MNVIRFNSSSPKKVNAAVQNIAQLLSINAHAAQQLKFHRPTSFEPELRNCFFNVWVQINFEGGDQQHGWIISQDSAKDFIEAQFHSVWVNLEGKFIDVTPRGDSEKRI